MNPRTDRLTFWAIVAGLLLQVGLCLFLPEHSAARDWPAQPATTQPATRPAKDLPIELYCLDPALCGCVQHVCAAAVERFPGEHPVVVLAFGHFWSEGYGTIECPNGEWLDFDEACRQAELIFPGHPLYLAVYEREGADQG